MGKDSDAIVSIALGILGLAALIKFSEKDCPHCLKKIARGTSQCPFCGNRV